MAFRVNALAVKDLASICQKLNIHLIQISTEYVFDGTKDNSPYREEDAPNPINWYGETKFWAEKFISESGCSYTIARICMPYTAKYDLKSDIARFFLNQLKNGQKINAIFDAKITPVITDDIAFGLSKVIEEGINGIIHIAPTNFTTPYDFVKLLARVFGLDEFLVKKIAFEEYNRTKKAKLLRCSWLSSEKLRKKYGESTPHSIEEDLKIFKQQLTS